MGIAFSFAYILRYQNSIISLNDYSNESRRTRYQKKRGAGPTCSSEARVGFADRAVEGGHSEGIGEALFSPSNILLVGVYHIRQKTASKAPG